MPMNLLLPTMICAAGMLAAASPARAGQSLPGDEGVPVSGKELQRLVRLCESCHGPGGASSRDDVPAIAGKSAADILSALEQFYYFERHCPDVPSGDGAGGRMSMCDIVNGLVRQDAMALGHYFETGKFPQTSD